MPEPLSLFGGVPAAVNRVLGLGEGSYGHRKEFLRLGDALTELQGMEVAEAVFREIERQFDGVAPSAGKRPSFENWRRKPHTDPRRTPTDSEVGLERRLVKARLTGDWWNQVPIASGLGLGRRCSIDLVHERDPDSYDFVELKVRSNNPIFAAVEILQYGFVWLLSRANRHRLGYLPGDAPLLAARNVRLCVLAPYRFYDGFDLRVFERGLSRKVEEIAGSYQATMAFRFFAFDWPPDDADDELLRQLLNGLFD